MIGLSPTAAEARATFADGPVPASTFADAAVGITSGNFTYIGYQVADFSGMGEVR
jgi:hypothetical protein